MVTIASCTRLRDFRFRSFSHMYNYRSKLDLYSQCYFARKDGLRIFRAIINEKIFEFYQYFFKYLVIHFCLTLDTFRSRYRLFMFDLILLISGWRSGYSVWSILCFSLLILCIFSSSFYPVSTRGCRILRSMIQNSIPNSRI